MTARTGGVWTTIIAFALMLPAAARAYDVEVLQQNGDPSQRIDLVVLGDGYRSVDQAKLTADANAFLDLFWQEAPFSNYRDYFNVKLIHVISNENGADNGSYGDTRDTALGAYFNCGGISRLLCVNSGAVFSVADADVPEWDNIFVIVNDPKYGGSGGSIAVFSVDDQAPQIALHEFGHSFAGLADEYEDSYAGYPTCNSDCPEPNVTNHTTRSTIKWNDWIDLATPLPTPETSDYGAVVGLFEGARYQSTGLYRPKYRCKMRSLGRPYCEVCAEAIVLSIYSQVTLIDSTAPASPVSISSCGSTELSFAHPTPDPDSLAITWSVDGSPVQTGGDHLAVGELGLGLGSHTVSVRVEDATGLVRDDPSGLLVDSHSWRVDVSGTGEGGCTIGGQCYPDGSLDPANPCLECRVAQDPTGWTADDSNSCDDGSYCNGGEYCQAGVCRSGSAPCADDGLACTDTCDEQTGRCNVLRPDWCLIAGHCIAAGTSDPANACESCQPAVSTSGWSPAAGACDDGLFCNGTETCQAGACRSGTAPCADDGLVCTTTCDEQSGACNALRSGWCLIGGACVAAGSPEPGNPCRECRPEVATDRWTADDSNGCDDGAYCNGTETCQAGVCRSGTAPCADDGLACTTTCDEQTDSCQVLQSGWCLIGGACVAAGSQEPGNPCRECRPQVTSQGWTADDSNSCDDGSFCNGSEHCQAGVCQAGSPACADDGLTCTGTCDEQADTCNALLPGWCLIAGGCVAAGAADPTNPCRTCQPQASTVAWTPDGSNDCDDGLECTGPCDGQSDSCNELLPGWCLIAGVCAAAGSPEPGNPCRVCQPQVATDAWTPDDSASCDDGLFCNGTETCQAGVCQAGAAPCADDGLVCTTACDEQTRSCNALQPDWCLIDGDCVGAGTPQPGNPCRACQPQVASDAFTADDGGSCDDGLFCNGAETCRDGVCQAGSAPCADDGLACTTTCDEQADSCGELLSGWCLIDGACLAAGESNPDNPCRACEPEQSTDDWTPDGSDGCDDGLECTAPCDARTGSCDELLAGWCLIDHRCWLEDEPDPDNPCRSCQPDLATDAFSDLDGAACDDGDPCTEGDTCQGGSCAAGQQLCSEQCPCDPDDQTPGSGAGIVGGCNCGPGGGSPAAGWPLGLGLLIVAYRRRRRSARSSPARGQE